MSKLTGVYRRPRLCFPPSLLSNSKTHLSHSFSYYSSCGLNSPLFSARSSPLLTPLHITPPLFITVLRPLRFFSFPFSFFRHLPPTTHHFTLNFLPTAAHSVLLVTKKKEMEENQNLVYAKNANTLRRRNKENCGCYRALRVELVGEGFGTGSLLG